MKCMIIGSCSPKAAEFDSFKITCSEIASALSDIGATLIISSLFEDSADYWVYNTFVNNNRDIELHYWDSESVRNRIKEVVDCKTVKMFPYLNDNTELSLSYAYLFCQLNAIKSADLVIAIGGKKEGSASLLLSLADNSATIIPFIQFNGAAKAYYDGYRYKLADIFGDQIGVLMSGNPKDVINAFHTLSTSNLKTLKAKNKKKIFISYARDNSKWADMTEVFLRRRNLHLFRDESDFKPGEPVQEYIMSELRSSDVFISLWCQEYACSPWCFDEMEAALDLADSMDIWIIRVDDTRIVPKRARNMHFYDVRGRQDLEGVLLNLIEGDLK